MDDQTQPSDKIASDTQSDMPANTPANTPPDIADTDNTADTANTSLPPPNARAAMTPDMEAEQPDSGAVPPGYDWPTHGGYLGCLLGMMPACLVAGFLGSTLVAWLNAAGVVHPVVAGLLVVALFIGSALGFGRIGWVLGRQFYRKYPRGEATWGEDDVAPAQSAGGQPGGSSEQVIR